jgi:tRNA G37 N-methylase TrmD
MVMQVKPIRDCLSKIKQNNSDTTVIYLSPQGQKLDNNMVIEFDFIMFITPYYFGVLSKSGRFFCVFFLTCSARQMSIFA